MTDRADGYERTAKIVLTIVRSYVDQQPSFRLGPKDVAILATLSDLQLAQNDTARMLIRAIVEVTRGTTAGEATYMMFQWALETCGVAFERGSLEELGVQLKPVGQA